MRLQCPANLTLKQLRNNISKNLDGCNTLKDQIKLKKYGVS